MRLRLIERWCAGCVAGLAILSTVTAGNVDWQIFAGSPTGPGLRDGPAAQALFNNPAGVACDALGNRYVADTSNHVIRKVTPNGEVTTLAGSPREPGSADGVGADARFTDPSGIALDRDGFLVVSDSGSQTVRRISPSGEVTTVAGTAGVFGSTDGQAGQASFNYPSGIAVDSENRIYVTDFGNHTIRRISPEGTVSTFAGLAGAYGSSDGSAATARFNNPADICMMADGSFCIADSGNNTIRRISADGEVSTLAGLAGGDGYGYADGTGSVARFSYPVALAADLTGNLIVADAGNHMLRVVTAAGRVTSLAGSAGVEGFADGLGDAARFNLPQGLAIHPTSGEITVGDSLNHALRTVTREGLANTLGGGPVRSGKIEGIGTAARFRSPYAIIPLSSGGFAVADAGNHIIRGISAAGETRTIAGVPGVSGSINGAADVATFRSPTGIAEDSSGNLFIADRTNKLIRKLSSAGIVSTHASAASFVIPENQWVTDQRFSVLSGVVASPSGIVHCTDHNQIRRVAIDGTYALLAGQERKVRFIVPSNQYIVFWKETLGKDNGDGSGADAVIGDSRGPCLDSSGNIYFADSSYHTIRRCTPGGTVTTIAGKVNESGSLDGTGAAARFKNPSAVALGPDGTLYVTESGNQLIRKISPGGVVTTIGGTAGLGGYGEGKGKQALFSSPSGLTFDKKTGAILIADTGNQRIMRGVPERTPQLIVEGVGGNHLASATHTIGFDHVTIGSSSPVRSVLLRNVGNEALAIQSIICESGSPGAFEILWNGIPDSLAPNGSMNVGVRYRPTAGGPQTSQLRIRTDDPDQPDFHISLEGAGNHAPGFSAYSFAATAGQEVRVSLRKLLAVASDEDGDPLTVTTSRAATLLGNSARTVESELVYTSRPGVIGNDQFQINIVDSHGAEIQGGITVTLTESASADTSLLTNPPKLSLADDGKATLVFHGIPGRSYIIQSSINLTDWATVATVVAAPNGHVEWTEPTVSGASIFYRLGVQ